MSYNEHLKNTPDVISLKQLQDILGIGKNTALRLVGSGEISGHKVAGKWRILKEDVLDYLIYH